MAVSISASEARARAESAGPGRPRRLSWARKLGFAAGDYGCNLYWQSMTLFLLYFYTEILHLTPTQAGLIYMIASIVEGGLDPLVGSLLDRRIAAGGDYRRWLMLSALPLGGLFVLLFRIPAMRGAGLLPLVLACHLLFRIAYSAVAVPYAAITVQMTRDTRERTTLSGLRMVFSALAVSTIAFCLSPLITTASAHGIAQPYMLPALVVSGVATAAFACAWRAAGPTPPAPRGVSPAPPRPGLVLRNTAFLNLLAALVLAMLSATALSKSLIYYFKYTIDQPGQARFALTACGIASLLAIPVWMAIAHRFGKRVQWLTAVALGCLTLLVFLVRPPGHGWSAATFFAVMQVVTDGVGIAYWSMLPDAVEIGEALTGARNEAILFGLFMFCQKAGLGIAAAVFGYGLALIGDRSGAATGAVDWARLPVVIAALSGAGLLGSGVVVFVSPLRQGAHERAVEQLADRGSIASG